MDYLFIHRKDGGVSVCGLRPGSVPAEELAKWQEQVAGGTDAAAWLPIAGFSLHTDPEFPSRRFRNAWQYRDGNIEVDFDKAKAIRVAELDREAAILTEAVAKEHMIATAKGDNAAAAAARKKVQDLAALDKAALEAGVVAVADLDTLGKHEPTAIKDAKLKVREHGGFGQAR